MRHVGEQQTVAVRRGLGGGLGTEAATGTSTVIDHDLLAKRFRQSLAKKAREHIRATAGRIWNDEGDWMIGIGLRPHR